MEENEFAQLAPVLRQTSLSVCFRMGASAEEAEDIAQDVMLRLWQLRGSLGRFHSLKAVTARMAHNMLLNAHRRQRSIPLDKAMQKQQTAAYGNPESLLEEREDEQWLAERLGRLPTTEHAILYMRQTEHRPIQEIAHILGITIPSVSTLLSKARRQLLEEIKRRNRK
ncbi:RNA polymerase sigma factor [Prevotella dentasini]|uniref:RNA polymerase sigma factor n=1 Tax=Prevotella dentasini TaxID=589537 RepID=UPI0004685D43|nr:sigma-70 family RNA polymerase sigma factor [Prevotella dentasini]